MVGVQELFNSDDTNYWTGTSAGGELHSNNCSGFSSNNGNSQMHLGNRFYFGETQI